MKEIILILLLSTGLIAGDFSYSGTLNMGYGHISQEYYEKDDYNNGLASANVQLNLDYENSDFYFQSSIFAYGYRMDNGDEVQLPNYYDTVDEQGIFFRSLYMSYKATDNLSIGAGVLPFSNSTPTKYNNDYMQDGEGIYMLNDNSLTSVFGIYKTEHSRTIVGLGTFDQILVPTGNYIDETLRKGGSYTAFAINTYEHNKFALTTEVLYNHIEYEKKDLADVTVGGVALVYDDSEDSGWSVYGVAGFSIYDNHNTDAKEAIYENTLGPKAPAGDYIASLYPSSFAIEDKTYYGAATLLGARKDFSLYRTDFFVSAEWFHTYGDWSSGNQGNIYMCQSNQTFNIRDNSYFLNTGYIISDSMLLRFNVTYLEYDEQGKIGAPASTVPNDEYLGDGVIKEVLSRMVFTYKF